MKDPGNLQKEGLLGQEHAVRNSNLCLENEQI